jgi:hypothetical protein
MTGPKDIIIASLVALLAICSVAMFLMRSTNQKLDLRIQLYEQRESEWQEEINDCADTIAKLRLEIGNQNRAAELAAELGAEARAAQRQAEEYARRMTTAERRLDELLEDQQRFDELVKDADLCQTYELVLRSIAGEVP